MEDIILSKVFVEARYKNAILFNDFSRLQKLINVFEASYPLNNYDQANKNLVFVDGKNQCNLNIGENRFVFDSQQPISEIDFEKKSLFIMNNIIEMLEINKFIRLGMRIYKTISTNNLDEANEYIKNTYLKINGKALYSLGEIFDFSCSVGFKSSIYKIMLRIQPQTEQLIEIEQSEIKNRLEKHNILIDTDTFRDEEMDSKAIAKRFVSDVFNINNSKVIEFIKHQEKII